MRELSWNVFLECNSALGMKNQTIPDTAIRATSYMGKYFPKYARINYKYNNKDIAWCTNITSGDQSLTVST